MVQTSVLVRGLLVSEISCVVVIGVGQEARKVAAEVGSVSITNTDVSHKAAVEKAYGRKTITAASLISPRERSDGALSREEVRSARYLRRHRRYVRACGFVFKKPQLRINSHSKN